MSPEVSIEAEVWGIGWYPDETHTLVPYRASKPEMVRHREVARERLGTLGVVSDDIVVLVASNHDAIQFLPWEEAANDLGAAFCVVDGSRFDAHRLSAYVTMFAPRAVLGLSIEVVEALDARGEDLAVLLADVPVIAALAEAHSWLNDRGIAAIMWNHLGPAVAVECRARTGAHLSGRWQPEMSGRELVLHRDDDQLLAEHRLRTGQFGTLETEPCTCGSRDPRFLPDPERSASGHW